MRVFADTFFFLAVLNPRDAAHSRAMAFVAEAVVDEMFTTSLVLTELADGLNRPGERQRCVRLIRDMRRNSRTRLLEPDAAIYWKGFELYSSRPDKEWSLTDCVSFVVMEREGLREALTGDRHFAQAGFVPLFAE